MKRMIPAVAAAAALTLPAPALGASLDLPVAVKPGQAEDTAPARHLQVQRQLVTRYQGVTGKRRAGWTNRELRRAIREERRERRERRAARRAARAAAAAAPATTAPATTTATPAHLEAIAACESGGDPSAIGGGGAYRGKYQFDQATWQAVGGTGDPAAAPESEQDMRAAMLYEQAGSSPWPVCGG